MENGINIVVEKVQFPSFAEFRKLKMNESVEAEMTLYSEIAARVEQLKEIYGDKALAKTGIIKSLMSVNELILTGKKENEQGSAQPVQPQPAQSSVQSMIQPQSQTTQPVEDKATQPAQSTQPQAQDKTQSQSQAQK